MLKRFGLNVSSNTAEYVTEINDGSQLRFFDKKAHSTKGIEICV